jgi:hypothetical protein
LVAEDAMLDLDHPQTPHIFAASNQLDMVLDFCKRISISHSSGRGRMLEIVRPCFAALRWLNGERFGNSPAIAAGITDLERAADQLARLGDGWAEWPAGAPSACPVCGAPITNYGVYEPTPGLKVPKERWCSPCLDVIMPALRRLRSGSGGFGTGAI